MAQFVLLSCWFFVLDAMTGLINSLTAPVLMPPRAFDPIKFYLSDFPPTIKHKDWMQINGGAEATYPNAPLIYLFTALKRNPRITNFRIDWE